VCDDGVVYLSYRNGRLRNRQGTVTDENGDALTWVRSYTNGGGGETTHETWTLDDKYHRTDGPAVIITRPGGRVQRTWKIHGTTHRDGAPADTLTKDGVLIYEEWVTDGVTYNPTGGPSRTWNLYGDVYAQEWTNAEGKRHRMDGPARESNGNNEYFIDGQRLTEAQYLAAGGTMPKSPDEAEYDRVVAAAKAAAEAAYGLAGCGDDPSELRVRMPPFDMISSLYDCNAEIDGMLCCKPEFCGICMETMDKDGVQTVCGNGHRFHAYCIGEWKALQQQAHSPATCPTCRAPLIV
jgi:hypothetical protein